MFSNGQIVKFHNKRLKRCAFKKYCLHAIYKRQIGAVTFLDTHNNPRIGGFSENGDTTGLKDLYGITCRAIRDHPLYNDLGDG